MSEQLWPQIASLGLGGIMFVMFWLERADRQKAEASSQALLTVVQSNTEAMRELRMELRSLRSKIPS